MTELPTEPSHNEAPAFNPYGFAVGIVVLFFLFAFAVHFRVRPQQKSDAKGVTTNGNTEN